MVPVKKDGAVRHQPHLVWGALTELRFGCCCQVTGTTTLAALCLNKQPTRRIKEMAKLSAAKEKIGLQILNLDAEREGIAKRDKVLRQKIQELRIEFRAGEKKDTHE